MPASCHILPPVVIKSPPMMGRKAHATPIYWSILGFLIWILIACPPNLEADPIKVESTKLTQQAADPYTVQVSVGPMHKYEPTYYMPGSDECPVLAYRVLILEYAYYDNIVLEELEFVGNKCQDIRIKNGYAVNGVELGYALDEDINFPKEIRFVQWESWNTFVVESGQQKYVIKVDRDGSMVAKRTSQTDSTKKP
jgi:hypothetical protein